MKKILQKINVIILVLIFIFPIYPKLNISNIVLYFAAGVSLINLIYQKENINKKLLLWIFFPILFLFIPNLIGCFQSEDLKNAMKILFKDTRYLIFPLIFYASSFNIMPYTKIVQLFSKYYTIAILLINLFCLSFWGYKYQKNLIYNYNTNIRLALEKVLDIHGTYFAILTGIGIILLFFNILYKKNTYQFNILTFLAILFLLVIQMHSLAEMPFYTTLIILFLMLVLRIVQSKKMRVVIIMTALLLSFIFISKVVIDLKTYTYDFTTSKKEAQYLEKDFMRIALYQTALNLFQQANWKEKILGIGTGDVKSKYNIELRKFNFKKIGTRTPSNFNNHNQYLSYLNSRGIIGLLFFFIFVFINLYHIYKYNNNYFDLYFCLISLFLFSFLTESVLERQHGIIIFGLLNSLFLTHALLNKYEKSPYT